MQTTAQIPSFNVHVPQTPLSISGLLGYDIGRMYPKGLVFAANSSYFACSLL